MRIERLTIGAYGHLEARSFDFATAENRIHVVYGLNEAGKTTVKAAIEALLFGIGKRTRYNFQFGYPLLSLSASLVNLADQRLAFTRIKRDRGDLQDERGNVLDDAVLSPYLGSLTEEQFRQFFSLSRDSMATGSANLLANKGDAGTSLYGAALGNLDLHGIIESFEERAGAVFKSTGRVTPLNRALTAFAEAKKRQRNVVVRHADREKLDLRREKLSEIIRGLDDAISTETLKLRRLEALLAQHGTYWRRRQVIEELAEIGGEPVLRPEVIAMIEQAREAAEVSRRTIEDAQERIVDHERNDDPDARYLPLLEHEPTIMSLFERVGAHEQSVEHLNKHKLETFAEQNHEEAQRHLLQLWPEVDVEVARARVIPQAVLSDGHILAAQHGALAGALELESKERDRLATERERLEEERAGLPPVPVVDGLRAVLLNAQRVVAERGDPDQRIVELSSRLTKGRERLGTRLRTLGLFLGTVAELQAASLPSEAEIATFQTQIEGIEKELEQAKDRRTTAEQRIATAERRIASLAQGKEVVTHADLDEARSNRDRCLAALEAAWDGPTATSEVRPLVAALRDATIRVDRVTDALLQLAGTLGKIEEQKAEQAAAEGERRTADEERSDLDAALERALASWTTLWTPVGLTPRRPAEMLAWLRDVGAMRTEAGALDAEEGDLEVVRRRREELGAALRRELVSHVPNRLPAEDGLLGPVFAAAEEVVEAAEALAARHQNIEMDLQRCRSDEAKALKRVQERDEALRSWATTWEALLAQVWLPAQTSPAAFADCMQHYTQFQAKDRQFRHDSSRAAGIRRDIAGYAAEVLAFVSAYAVDLVESAQSSPAVATKALQRRLTAAQQAQTRQDERREAIGSERATIEREMRRVGEQETTITDLLIQHQIDPAQLDAVLVRSRHLHDLQAERDRTTAALVEALGMTTEAIDLAYAGQARPDLQTALTQATEALDTYRDQRDEEKKNQGDVERELTELDTSEAAIEAQAELVAHRAQIHRLGREWLVYEAACQILREEMRRYLAEHQGPVLTAASAYFAQLTEGGYVTLRIVPARDGTQSIELVDAHGHAKEVEDLSDGTRDQLYFALRLATLDEYIKTNEPQPLILDDTLVQFDDHRTARAFKALESLSERIQVIYFTHHEAVRDVALGAVSANAIEIHTLPARWALDPTPALATVQT